MKFVREDWDLRAGGAAPAGERGLSCRLGAVYGQSDRVQVVVKGERGLQNVDGDIISSHATVIHMKS